jgi:poly-gamma-glutamate synthesis protein (capsule biosynthesis protein)
LATLIWATRSSRSATSAVDALRSTFTDFTIANAESPISDRTEPWNPAKKFSHTSRPAAAAALARVGVDAVTLANNHAFDAGPEGLADTIRNLDAAGIASVGAGPNLARAEQPLLLRTEFGTLGVVSIGESFGHRASEDRAGTLVLSREQVHRGATSARAAGADWVVAAVHWGDNYAPINATQRAFAQEFATAGYDLVIGHGPHTVQPIEYVGSMPVIYSIGNSVFGTNGRYMQFGAPGFGLSVNLNLSPDTAPQVAVRCLLTDNLAVNFQPRPCTPDEAAGFLPTLTPQLTLQGEAGVLRCDGCFARRADAKGEQ